MFASAIQRLNDRRDAVGDAGEDAGFTLIELMVVLLILAILLAIAIPTFLGVTKSANDRAAQSNLNTALVNAKAYYQNQSQTYNNTAAAVTALSSAEPSLTFQSAASTSQNQISVFVPRHDGHQQASSWPQCPRTEATAGTPLTTRCTGGNRRYPVREPGGYSTPSQCRWHLLRSAEECASLHCVDHRCRLGPATPSRATDSLRRRSLIQTVQGVRLLEPASAVEREAPSSQEGGASC